MTWDIAHKTVLGTGGSAGIGKETARGLARQGARVLITGRDPARGAAAVDELRRDTGNAAIEFVRADFASLDGVRELAREVPQRSDRLDVLVNNVGLLEGTRRLTTDGLEAHFAVNVVAPYLLSVQLLPLLRRSTAARIVGVTGGVAVNQVDLDNLQATKTFMGLPTYSHAKTVMSALFLELARQWRDTGVSVNVVYPGSAGTDMTRAMTPDMVPTAMRLVWPLFTRFMKGAQPANAARSSIRAASDPALQGVTGAYLNASGANILPPRAARDHSVGRAVLEVLIGITGEQPKPA